MKSVKFLFFSAILSLTLFSCENSDIEFDDYEKSALYFPVQRPARTLILGNYELGYNINDNNKQFEIGATLAGMYSNKKDRKFEYKVDLSLLDNVANVQALPESYYTILTPSPVTIPAGEMKGRIKVQLTDAFFNDVKAIAPFQQVNYVIPLRITSVQEVDTFLQGKAIILNPIHVAAKDWLIGPKDYVLYGVKFINKYDATYLRRGVDRVLSNTSEVVYRNQYIERDEVVSVTTSSLHSVTLSNMIRRSGQATPGKINLKLEFDDKDGCVVYNADNNEKIGIGNFQVNSQYGVYSKKAHDVISLDYTYVDNINSETHQVFDTLVYRNRNVKYEEFAIKLK